MTISSRAGRSSTSDTPAPASIRKSSIGSGSCSRPAKHRSPFRERIKTNEPAHWVRPELVAQVRFTEWTADRKLRHPVYLGLRDDKRASEVTAPDARSRAAPRPSLRNRSSLGNNAEG